MVEARVQIGGGGHALFAPSQFHPLTPRITSEVILTNPKIRNVT